MKWVTADLHFGHANIIKYVERRLCFRDVDEMDATLIERWNQVVGKRDHIYHLGDFTFGGLEVAAAYIKRLNGVIHFVEGSHDRWMSKIRDCNQIRSASNERIHVHSRIHEIKFDGKHIVLCHYAMRTWPRSHHGSYHFYGHSHGQLPPSGNSMDVGVDNPICDFYPLRIDQALALLGSVT
jgi:calcineurin-like phosphoesterase family protein